MNWAGAVAALGEQGRPFVLVTILAVRGSAPRDAQAKMVVSEDATWDSIGGGKLEHEAVTAARNLLRSGATTLHRETVVLGPDADQCCAGEVELLYECFGGPEMQVALFGAGHVGQALVQIMAKLPWRVDWFDSREAVIEQLAADNPQHGIRPQLLAQPEVTVESLPDHVCFLVVTHSHELDLQLVEAILSRPAVRFCGLIGSNSKAVNFRRRLERKGLSAAELERLECPVGLPGVGGKRPAEVAVSIVARLLSLPGG